MLKVRPANLNDAETLASLAEETFRATYSEANSVEDMTLHCQRNFGKELQSREILDSSMCTLVCEAEQRLVGFAQLCWQETPECLSNAGLPGEIRRFYVSADFHGRGVAQALMSASLAALVEQGSDIAWLGVWEHNPRAIAFYKKAKFRVSGEYEFYLGDDRQRDIVMSQLL